MSLLLRLCSRFRLFCWRLCFLRWGKFKAAVTTSQHNFNVEVFWRMRLFGFWKVVQIFQSEIFKNVKSAWWRKRLFSPSANAAADYYATVSDRNHRGAGRRFDLQGGGGASALNQASQSKKAAVHQSEDSEEWHHTDRSSDRRGHILKARLHLRQVPSDMYMRCGRDSTPDQNLNRRTDRGRGRSEPRRKNNRFHKVLLFKV